MKIAVIGANDRTGRIVVKDALTRGHQVVAVARTDQVSNPDDDNLTNAHADVRDADALKRALVGANAVVSALGVGTSRAPTDVYSTGRQQHARRDEVKRSHQTRGRLGGSRRTVGGTADPPTPHRTAASGTHLRRHLRRHAAHEAILRDTTEVDWISLRPPRLVNKRPKAVYRIDTRPLTKAGAITYGDLATALLDSLTRQDLYQHAAYVAN